MTNNPESYFDDYGIAEDPEIFVNSINQQRQPFKDKDSLLHHQHIHGPIMQWWLRFLQTFADNDLS